MLNALRKRIANQDEGFTLIELMVVVLIIGILMAIAIPTFLGAKGSANDRSAQSNLKNGLTSEDAAYTDSQQFDNAATIQPLEPAIKFTAAATGVVGSVIVNSFQTVTVNDSIELTDKSQSGSCFAVVTYNVGKAGIVAGTYYYSKPAPNLTCASPALPGATANLPAHPPAVGGWATAW